MHVRPGDLPESIRRSTEYIMESLREHSSLDEEQQSDLASEIVAVYTEIAQTLEHEKLRSATR
jgi:flagellin-specific chaperone FliS